MSLHHFKAGFIHFWPPGGRQTPQQAEKHKILPCKVLIALSLIWIASGDLMKFNIQSPFSFVFGLCSLLSCCTFSMTLPSLPFHAALSRCVFLTDCPIRASNCSEVTTLHWNVCFCRKQKKFGWSCAEVVYAVFFFTFINEPVEAFQLFMRTTTLSEVLFQIDLITITLVDTLEWQLNLCMRRNVISSVLTQLQLPVMSTEPICAPVSLSSPSLIHSLGTVALCFDFAG